MLIFTSPKFGIHLLLVFALLLPRTGQAGCRDFFSSLAEGTVEIVKTLWGKDDVLPMKILGRGMLAAVVITYTTPWITRYDSNPA